MTSPPYTFCVRPQQSGSVCVKDQTRAQLGESDAPQETRNRFRLRRPSRVADYELRIRDWRIFYRVVDETVQVVLVGRKSGNFLIVDRKRLIL